MYDELARYYDDVVDGVDYALWARFMHDRWAVADADVHRVLDVCCGTGLMAAEMIRLGYAVTGIDGSASMLDRARDLLGPDVPLSRSVLPALDVTGPFDAAISNFDSLNYLSVEDCGATLAAIAAQLRPGGWLVFDVHTEHLMRVIAAEPVTEGRAGAKPFRMENAVDLQRRTCDTNLELSTDDGTVIENHRQYFFAEDELRAMLADAGLAVVAVHDDYTEAPLQPQTLRATWVARKAR